MLTISALLQVLERAFSEVIVRYNRTNARVDFDPLTDDVTVGGVLTTMDKYVLLYDVPVNNLDIDWIDQTITFWVDIENLFEYRDCG